MPSCSTYARSKWSFDRDGALISLPRAYTVAESWQTALLSALQSSRAILSVVSGGSRDRRVEGVTYWTSSWATLKRLCISRTVPHSVAKLGGVF